MTVFNVIAALFMLGVPVALGALQLRDFSREQKQR